MNIDEFAIEIVCNSNKNAMARLPVDGERV